MENYKDLYEIEKRQRLNVEKTMKEIVNGLCLSAYTIAEDSKMQMLKSDVQRIQQEIARLEATKQERLQQHLMSVGGMIQQMTGTSIGGGAGGVPAGGGLNLAQGLMPGQALNQRAVKAQAVGGAQSQQSGRLLQNFGAAVNGTPSTQQGTAFQKPKAPTNRGGGRRKRTSEEVARPSSALPPQPLNAAGGVSVSPSPGRQATKRPASAVPPTLTNKTSVVTESPVAAESSSPMVFVEANPPVVESAAAKALAIGPNGDESVIEFAEVIDETSIEHHGNSPAVDEQKSQVEEDAVLTVGIVPAKDGAAEKKNKYFCEYCETEAVDEPSTIVHVWSHVNEIRHTYAFECVVAGCLFKTNATKDALAHKKSAHTAEDECKILDRRDTLAEYFKHCVSKYFIHLDDDAKSRVFEARHL